MVVIFKKNITPVHEHISTVYCMLVKKNVHIHNKNRDCQNSDSH